MAEGTGAAPRNPFKGLRSYEQADRDAIFGRDMDFTLMRERLYSARTTLLFAASGVGKTSFISARLLPSVSGEFVTCYHRAWADEEPRLAVLRTMSAILETPLQPDATLETALEGFRRKRPADPAMRRELPLRPSASKAPDFLLVLDQFEEVFQYYAFRPEFTAFLDQLCALVNSDEIGVRIVISMRDDFLGRLSVFDNRIPDLFNNYYRLKSPTKTQTMEIIQRTAALVHRSVDAAALGALVDDLAMFRRTVPKPSTVSGEKGPAALLAFKNFVIRVSRPAVRVLRALMPVRKEQPAVITTVAREFVVPPYLQIVCHELWERAASNEAPFLSDYPVSTGHENPASDILDTFCRTRLNGLESARQRDLAAKAFDFLMTRDGAKMAYQLGRLAEHMGVKQTELEPVLKSLSDEDSRILRRFKGTDDSWWYELYHDMYALILSDWKRGYQTRRGRQKQVAVYAALLAAVVLGLYAQNVGHDWSVVQGASEDYPMSAYDTLSRRLTLGGTLPFMQRIADRPWADYLDRRAARFELMEDRDRALLLRMQGLGTKRTDERLAAATRLSAGEYRTSLVTTWHTSQPVRTLLFSRDEKLLFAATGDGLGRIWDLTAGTIASLSLGATRAIDRGEELQSPTFLKDGGGLLTLSDRGNLQLWVSRPDRPEWQRAGCKANVTAYAVDGNRVVVGRNGGLEQMNIETPRDECGGTTPPDAPSASDPFPSALGAEDQTTAPRRGAPRDGARAPIHAIAIVSGGHVLTATSNDSWADGPAGEVCPWDARTLQRRRCFIRSASAVQFDLNARRIAVLSGDFFRNHKGDFQLYDLAGGRIGSKSVIKSDFDPDLVFRSDGKFVHVVATDSTVATFNAETGALVAQTATSDFPTDPAQLSPQGLVALLSDDEHVWISNVESQLQAPVIRAPVSALAFSPKGTYLVTASPDDAIRVWRTDSFVPASPDLLSWKGRAAPVMLSESGRCAVYVDGGGQLLVRGLISGKVDTMQWPGRPEPDTPPDNVAAEPNCRRIAAAWSDGTVRLWDVASRTPIGPSTTSAASVPPRGTPSLLFSPDGTRLLATWNSVARRVSGMVSVALPMQLWDTSNGALVSHLTALAALPGTVSRARVMTRVVFTADSQAFVIAWPRVSLQVYSAATGARESADLPRGTPFGFSGAVVGIGAEDGAYLVERTSSSPVSVRLGESVSVTSIAFSPDGARAATIEADTLKIYDVATRRELPFQSTRRFSQVKFHPANNRLVAVSSTGVQLVEIDQEKRPKYVGLPIMIGPPAAESRDEEGARILSVEFSSSGRAVIIATRQWLHRLAITNTGLQAVSSRLLSGSLAQTNGIRMLDSAGIGVAAIVQTGAASRIEIVDFGQSPSADDSGDDLKAWERRLGLHLDPDTGEIAFRPPAVR